MGGGPAGRIFLGFMGILYNYKVLFLKLSISNFGMVAHLEAVVESLR